MIAHLQLPNPCILLGKKRLHLNYISPHTSLLFRSASLQPLVSLNIHLLCQENYRRNKYKETTGVNYTGLPTKDETSETIFFSGISGLLIL